MAFVSHLPTLLSFSGIFHESERGTYEGHFVIEEMKQIVQKDKMVCAKKHVIVTPLLYSLETIGSSEKRTRGDAKAVTDGIWQHFLYRARVSDFRLVKCVLSSQN